MQMAAFKARCPYEIGDVVVTSPDGIVKTIHDIRTIHYIRSLNVEFEFQFTDSKVWFPMGKIEKRIIL